jgi:cysteine synthase A
MSNFLLKPKIVSSMLELIGGTPMLKLGKYANECGVVSNILLKMEIYNSCFSVKDRIVLSIIEEAEKRGDIIPGKTTIVEITSGNTGISLAMICAIKGYDCKIVMPMFNSLEKKLLIMNYGAKLILTPGNLGMRGAIIKANQIIQELNGSGFLLDQFNNPDAIKVHREKTGPEIWYQTDNKVDILIGGIGTGSTIVGISQFIKSVNPDLKIIAVEPEESAVLSGEEPNMHEIQGIGVGFIPPNVDVNIFDEIVKVNAENAKKTVNELLLKEGINLGFSSGASLYAAINVGKRPENANKNIVIVVSSCGERYLHTSLFSKNYNGVNALYVENISL